MIDTNPEPLQVVSLFSGVEGIGLGFESTGAGVTVASCEIDKHARGVINDRRPDVTLFDDVTKVTADDLIAAGADPSRTVLTAGFPCQDLSVAGRRRGMGEGTRSGLFWHVDRLLAEFGPRWTVLENVPGLLSAVCPCPGDGTCVQRRLAVRCVGELHTIPGGACYGECISRHGGAMGAVLGALGNRGYGFAYRVLDARRFGVPQRRRRVVIVGRLGDNGTASAAVLAEPEGLRWHLAPRLTPWEEAAARAGGRAPAGSRPGVNGQLTVTGQAGSDYAHTLMANGDSIREDGTGRGCPVVSITGSEHTHSLTSEGFDASEDGTGRGTPVVTYAPEDAATVTATGGGQRGGDNADANVIAFSHTQGLDPQPDSEAFPTLRREGGGHAVYVGDETHALTTGGGFDDNVAAGSQLVAFQKTTRPATSDHPDVWEERDESATLSPHDLGSDTRTVEIVVGPVKAAFTTGTGSVFPGGTPARETDDSPALDTRSTPNTNQGAVVVLHEAEPEPQGIHLFPDGGISVNDSAPTLMAGDRGAQVMAQHDGEPVGFHSATGRDLTDGDAPTLDKSSQPGCNQGTAVVVPSATVVRRLTPTECERLQGFPDGWTSTSWGKPQGDSHRYREMGNAVAVPVFAWVGSRLAAVNAGWADLPDLPQ